MIDEKGVLECVDSGLWRTFSIRIWEIRDWNFSRSILVIGKLTAQIIVL